MKFREITQKQIIDTCLVFSMVFIGLGLYYDIRLYFFMAIGVLAIAILFPVLFKPIAFLWFGLSHALGAITSFLIISIVFFIVVTPVGVLRRLLGKDSLALTKFKKDKSSALNGRQHTYTNEDMKYSF